MADKVYIEGNYFIWDREGVDILIQDSRGLVVINPVNLTPGAEVYQISSPKIGVHVLELSNLQDKDGIAYTKIRFETIIYKNTASMFSESLGDFDIEEAIREVKSRYGDDISILDKARSLKKFGRNDNVQTTATTIMRLPAGVFNENYVSTNIIDTLSSDNAADTVQLTIEGHTIDGNGDFTFVEQTATLNGQNKVVLTTPLARVDEIYNSNGIESVGAVYCYEDTAISVGVPIDGSKVHCITAANKQHSQKAATTTAKDEYWIVTEFYSDVLDKNAAYSEIDFEVREKNGVFMSGIEVGATSFGSRAEHPFKPYFIVPPNSDVRLRALAGANGIVVSGGIQGYLAKIIE